MNKFAFVDGKTALVTGAGAGIGRAVTELLAAHGCHVIAGDISDMVATYSGKENITPVLLDVREPPQWKQAIATGIQLKGRIDWLFNVAGVIAPEYVYEADTQHIDRVIDINLKGTMYGCSLVSPYMVRQGSGHIVNISSLAGLAPVPGLSIYVASKFGVRGYSLAIALELKDKGVKVTVVCPDATNTHMLDEQVNLPEATLTFSGDKVLSPEEVAEAIIRDGIGEGKGELWLPKSRGMTAMASSLFPEVAKILYPLLLKKGAKKQAKYISGD